MSQQTQKTNLPLDAIIAAAARVHKDKVITIAESLLQVDETIITERTEFEIKQDEKLAEAVDIVNLLAQFPINPENIYCSKTGKPIGTRSPDELSLLVKVNNVADIKALVDLVDLASAPSLAWIKTDPDSLRNLALHDPCGFYIYCASYFTIYQHKTTGVGIGWHPKKGWRNNKERIEFQKSKIVGYQMISKLNEKLIRNANEIWIKALGMMRPDLMPNIKYNMPHEMCTFEAVKSIPNQFAKILATRVMAFQNEISRGEEFTIRNRMKEKYYGNSSFHQIGKMDGVTLMEELSNLFVMLGVKNASIAEIRHANRVVPQEITKKVDLQIAKETHGGSQIFKAKPDASGKFTLNAFKRKD